MELHAQCDEELFPGASSPKTGVTHLGQESGDKSKGADHHRSQTGGMLASLGSAPLTMFFPLDVFSLEHATSDTLVEKTYFIIIKHEVPTDKTIKE